MRVMELHAPMRIVQRSSGRTATGAAAYRAAERIECQRTGQVHDYTRKTGVEATELLAAENAPEWTRDRNALWNAAELREKHPRAQTAREIEVAFPHEFNAEQRREAGRSVARLLIDRYGAATDIAWHNPSRRGDQRNFHAHILFTARPIENGNWAKNKRTALDDRQVYTGSDGQVTTRAQEELKSLRGAVAGVLNHIAARDKVAVYVEHLSFEERGLDREATQHMGPNATEMERRGEASDIGERNRQAQQSNRRREELEEERSNVLDFSDGQLKFRRRNAWEVFYRDSMGRRAALAHDLEEQYGAQEQEATQACVQIRQAQQQRNLIARVWSRFSGRARREQYELEQHAATLRAIAEKKRLAQEAFEADRMERLHSLKAELDEADREAQERFDVFLAENRKRAETEKLDAFGNEIVTDWIYDDFTGAEKKDNLREESNDDPVADLIRERMNRSRKRGHHM